MKIGVLALQGGFAEHIIMLRALGATAVEIRKKQDAQAHFDGLIIPGGESTVMGKLLRELDLFNLLADAIKNGLPVFGTCAGLLLLAEKIENEASHLATLPITAKRNAYGRQLGSFQTEAHFTGIGKIPAVFIRAPYIARAASSVEILCEVQGKITAARQENQLVTAFHPELSDDLQVHDFFLRAVVG